MWIINRNKWLEWTKKADAQRRPTIAMVDRKYQKQENRTNNLILVNIIIMTKTTTLLETTTKTAMRIIL